MRYSKIDKISYIETCINDIENLIQSFRDGEYDGQMEDEDDFWASVAQNAQCIHDEAMRD